MPSFPLLPPSKRRRHGRRFKKWAELNSATAAAVFGGLGSLSAGPAGFLSAGLAGSLSADFAGSLSASLAGSSEPATAASEPIENLVRNRVEFHDFG